MNVDVYYLKARSPFHFGVGGGGVGEVSPWPHADTLFAALCLELQALYGTAVLRDFLSPFRDKQPPLLLSSAFPYAAGKEGKIRFYPRPFLRRLYDKEGSDPKAAKKFKKIQLISEQIFTDWVSGEDLTDHWHEENLLQDGHLWVTQAEQAAIEHESIWKEAVTPRVTLDRAASQSQIFQSKRVRFAKDCGLWLAIRWLDEKWREKVETALCSLGDAGIGGERSAGHGQFELEKGGQISLPAGDGGLVTTLSPYCPADQAEMAQTLTEDARYSLMTRRGWLGSLTGLSLRHKSVRMLAEGAVFAGQEDGVYGRLVDVTPKPFNEHAVYRYGFAFPVGVAQHE